MKQRGQMELSFGVIFSIFLIIVFVFVAGYVILNFIYPIQSQVGTSLFLNDLSSEIRKYYQSPGGGEKTISLKLGGDKVTHICFYNFELSQKGPYLDQYENIRENFGAEENFYFYPRKFAQPSSAQINYVDMNLSNNPECFEKSENGFDIRIKKSENEVFVKVSQA
jgi:hypothetical protein